MIDQDTINKIFDAADIVDVVQDFVSLKKRGTNYLGLCPFHNEKTPSFSVSPSKGIYKCFGCGKGGNPVNFVMEHENFTYVEALKFLANKYHIEIVEKEESEEEKQQKNDRENLIIVSLFAQRYFTRTLHETAEGKAIGLSYFRERGFNDSIIEKFQLGYSPEQKDAFTKEAVEKGHQVEFLEKAGLTIRKENWQIDRFHGRVIFPIHSISGQVIGFGGRILKTDKKVAKYLNSPESDIYHKSKVLYGLLQAKKAITQKDKCLMVEGYTDVISFHQAGVENVVASSGTALSIDQVRLIKRFTNNITVLFDGDAAGIKASLRGIDIILEQGLNVRVVSFPPGEDPDSFSKSCSSSELIEFLEKSEQDFISFKTNLLLKDAENDPIKRAELLSDIVGSISVIPEKPVRAEFVSTCARILKVDEEMLHFEINKRLRNKSYQKTDVNTEESKKAPVQPTPEPSISFGHHLFEEEKVIARLLLHYGNNLLFTNSEEKNSITVFNYVAEELGKDELTINNPIFKKILDEYLINQNQGKEINIKHFTFHPDAEISKTAANLLADKAILSQIWTRHDSLIETEEMILGRIVPRAINEFKFKYIKHKLKEITSEMIVAQNNNDFDKIIELQKQKIMLDIVKGKLSTELGERTIM
ncbi:MAG: DNA primase [Bacteroidales bacterium]|nr:DNA primase [Bacteroidales bacterium]